VNNNHRFGHDTAGALALHSRHSSGATDGSGGSRWHPDDTLQVRLHCAN